MRTLPVLQVTLVARDGLHVYRWTMPESGYAMLAVSDDFDAGRITLEQVRATMDAIEFAEDTARARWDAEDREVARILSGKKP